MSAHLSPAPSLPFAGPHLVVAARLAWRRFRRAYALALRDEVSRRDLRRLDERMLADVGITRDQATRPSARRPWVNI
jgi:uncharacterized protein YjiS (DUF1127 family)